MLLDLDGRGPRYVQIARGIVRAIEEGVLIPGARLPSTRQMATDLGCSRNLVVLAFEQLTLQGYLVAEPRRGTCVSRMLPTRGSDRRSFRGGGASPGDIRAPGRGARGTAVVAAARRVTADLGRHAIDFAYGISRPDMRLLRRVRTSFAAALRKGLFGYGDPAGDPALRHEIAMRLRASRAMGCTGDQVVVTSGAQQALDICARLLLVEGDRAVVEDPGYEAARAAFRTAGAEVVPVPVDRDGLPPADLPVRVRLAYVTPSHQFPTGGILAAPRRHALLSWARREDAFVIEDDYDGELRFQGGPVKALAAMDRDGRVIYCATFAKTMFPAIRLGYLVLPPPLVEAAVDLKWLLDRGSSLLLQRVVRDLMTCGEYDRHLRRMKRRHAPARRALVRSLESRLGDRVEVWGAASGLHLVAWLPALSVSAVDELVERCSRRGVGVYSVERHAMLPCKRGGLIMGYGLVDAAEITEGVDVVTALLRRMG